jgi:hypothetical protein
LLGLRNDSEPDFAPMNSWLVNPAGTLWTSASRSKMPFRVAVPADAAKKTATNPDDEDALRQEAEHLAAELLPIAMTGHPREEGKMSCDFPAMRFPSHLKTSLNIRLMRRKTVCACGCWERKSNNLENSCCLLPFLIILLHR